MCATNFNSIGDPPRLCTSNTPLRPPGTKMLPQDAFIFSLFFIVLTELARKLDEVGLSPADSCPRELSVRASQSLSLKLSLFRFLG
ncbi:protein of unknown function [Hyphomicrobium sp. 1Nfss2.1]